MRGSHHPLHPHDRGGARRRARAPAARRSCCSTAAAGRTSSPAAPAGTSGCARTATSRWSCIGARRHVSPAITAATASACPSRCPECGRCRVARHGAGTERLEHELREALGDADFPVFRLDADAAAGADRRATTLAALRAPPRRRAGRHADGGQGPRLPRRHARRRARRRPDAALPGLPRRGAHVRADHAARRTGGRGGAGRAGACSCRRSRPTRALDPLAAAARHRGLPRRRAGAPPRSRYPPFATLIRIVCSAPEPAMPQRVAAARCATASTAPGATRARARRRCSGCAAARAPARGQGDRRAGGDRRRRGGGRRDRAGRGRRGVSVSVDVDPQ